MIRTAISALVITISFGVSQAFADPIRHLGQNAELSVDQISDFTARIALSPLDDKGMPLPGKASTAFVEQKSQNKLLLRDLNSTQKVTVGKMTISVKPAPLTITCQDAAGKVFQELIFSEPDGAMSFRTASVVLGLGEGEKQYDRSGSLYPMLNGQRAPLLATHGSTIPVPFLIGTDGWALYVHRPWGQFDLRGGKGKFLPTGDAKGMKQPKETPKGPLEVYVVSVEEPAVALQEYYRLSGKPVMPPKWTMGYMQSHRSLELGEPVEIAKTFRDKQLPVDAVIYLGTGYTNGQTGWNMGHGTFEFNPKTFDKPAEYVKSLHDMNFKLVLHINKAPPTMHGLSITEKSMDANHISNYWAKHKALMNMDVNGWWPDDGDELPIEARLARHRCYYEGPLLDRPNERPWSLHRNGFAGAQRYGGWIWSGDNESRWETLKVHVPVGINYSLSLTPFWGTDIGGFVPKEEFTGELYARWFQFGAFNPLFRSHGRNWKLRLPWGWNLGEVKPIETKIVPNKSELSNAAIEPICKKYLELRYQLLPYNYTLMREACDTGLPPMRALWLHYPSDPMAAKDGEDYLWGRDILVAPVVAKGARERSLYLPAGSWYDWWTNEKIAGGKTIKRPVDLATMPLYVRAGAIIPFDPIRQYTSQAVTEPTTLKVYRGADGQFVLYDDDGKSLEYLKGQGTWTKITWNDGKGQLVIEPDARTTVQGQVERAFDVMVMPEGTKKRVTYSGKRVEVGF
ncbi:MAG TPA: TIM-barrel domain-containing protein [Gemmataceae bacterium]|nr:TIM-barrel domain-containing protein [Gemmataceae bacterium]